MSDAPAAFVPPEQKGPIMLYRPVAPTTIAAIYSHGSLKEEIAPLGVTLRYYGPHGDPVITSITEAASRGEPNFSPEVPNSGGKWGNYTLTEITQLRADSDSLNRTANDIGWAIAYVQDETDTVTVVGLLSEFSDIRGVHCRVGVVRGEPKTVNIKDLVGWTDVMMFETIGAETELEAGTPLADPSGKDYVVLSVKADKDYEIQELMKPGS